MEFIVKNLFHKKMFTYFMHLRFLVVKNKLLLEINLKIKCYNLQIILRDDQIRTLPETITGRQKMSTAVPFLMLLFGRIKIT